MFLLMKYFICRSVRKSFLDEVNDRSLQDDMIFKRMSYIRELQMTIIEMRLHKIYKKWVNVVRLWLEIEKT